MSTYKGHNERRAHEERSVRLLANLYQRREDLKRIYSEAAYRETMDVAIKSVLKWSETRKVNTFNAALEYGKLTPDPARQFVLVAALEIAEAHEAEQEQEQERGPKP